VNRHLVRKTHLFAILVILTNVLGNFSLSWGMHQVGRLVTVSPLAYVQALFNPWVATGVGLLILWMLSQMTLLSWADLSYVLPVTSVGYVLAALMGHFFMAERISPARWAGIGLIMVGVALVGDTHPSTHKAGA
jgi:uncharacterized membrane protein